MSVGSKPFMQLIAPRARGVSALGAPWLGMGCAEIAGTITRARSLRALEFAFDQGIVYFDVARSYGFGRAERIVGDFLKGKRDQVVVATKAGIPPAATSNVRLALRQRLARPARRLRKWLSAANRSSMGPPRGTGGNRDRSRFEVSRIRDSLERSLQELQTDYVDVFHLHSCAPADVSDELLAFLEKQQNSGKVRQLGLATSAQECAPILARSGLFRIVQFRDNLHEPSLEALGAVDNPASVCGSDIGIAMHSIFGRDGTLRSTLQSHFRRHESFRSVCRDRWGFDGTAASELPAMLLQLAFARNSGGLIISGMSTREHILRNVATRAGFESSWNLSELWKLLRDTIVQQAHQNPSRRGAEPAAPSPEKGAASLRHPSGEVPDCASPNAARPTCPGGAAE